MPGLTKRVFLILLSLQPLIFAAQTEFSEVLAFDTAMHDFGVIKQGSAAEHTFTFKNICNKPVTIVNVKATCGCTATSWTQDPVKPGKTGFVKVKYNTGIIGAFYKSVTVVKNDHGRTILLFIKGEVIP